MMPNLEKGTGLSGAVRYVLGEGKGKGNDWKEGTDSRVSWISGTGFGFAIESRADADLARRMMEFAAANQTSRTRKTEKDVMHLSLSWHPDERPTREQMETAAHDALTALGMGNARALIVAHNDTPHAHVHIVASRINPETGRAFNDWDDQKTVQKWAHGYELAAGVIRCERRVTVDGRDPAAVLTALTRDHSTFTRRDLDRLLYKSIVSRAERKALADTILARPEVIGLRDRADTPVTRYTTRDVLAAERQVIKDAASLAGDTSHGLTARQKAEAIDRHPALSHEQRAALDHATNAEGLAIVAGEAGTGKSTTLAAIRDAYEDSGKRVIGLAWTNAVVQDMKQTGFTDASTIAAELVRLEKGSSRWDRNTVLIVDEAAMLSTKQLATVTDRAAEAGAKVILAGDDKQLASIERGGMFTVLRQDHGAAELHDVHRVSDLEQKGAFNQMHEGNFRAALDVFDRKGAIQWTDTQDAARTALVAQYAKDTATDPGKARFVFAYTNVDVDAFNRDIRAMRKERGDLGADTILRTKDGPESFAAGDRVQFTGNGRFQRDRDAGYTNGTVGTITAIDGLRVTMELDGRKGDKARVVTFTVGENREAGEFNSFRHGYAGTIYKGQGKTLDQTYLYHSKHWRAEAGYVAMTRHRDTAAVFVAKETAADLDQLAGMMSRSDEKRAASQFVAIERPSNQFAEASRDATERPEAPADVERLTVAEKDATAAQRAAAQAIAARLGKITDPAKQAAALARQHRQDTADRPASAKSPASSGGDWRAKLDAAVKAGREKSEGDETARPNHQHQFRPRGRTR
jgi:Ti-type conjugative transfer relaxase TraA